MEKIPQNIRLFPIFREVKKFGNEVQYFIANKNLEKKE